MESGKSSRRIIIGRRVSPRQEKMLKKNKPHCMETYAWDAKLETFLGGDVVYFVGSLLGLTSVGDLLHGPLSEDEG